MISNKFALILLFAGIVAVIFSGVLSSAANCQEIGTEEGQTGPSGPKILHGEIYLEKKFNDKGDLVQSSKWLDDFTPEELKVTFHLADGSEYFIDGKLDKPKFVNDYVTAGEDGLVELESYNVTEILKSLVQ